MAGSRPRNHGRPCLRGHTRDGAAWGQRRECFWVAWRPLGWSILGNYSGPHPLAQPPLLFRCLVRGCRHIPVHLRAKPRPRAPVALAHSSFLPFSFCLESLQRKPALPGPPASLPGPPFTLTFILLCLFASRSHLSTAAHALDLSCLSCTVLVALPAHITTKYCMRAYLPWVPTGLTLYEDERN